MSKSYKSSEICLHEMFKACRKIKEYVAATTREEFINQRESYDAICMQFSHMGEQVSLLEKHTDKIIPHFPDEVDWSGVKGLRNRIDHAYASIDVDLIWKFANEDVQGIEDGVRRILKKRFGVDPSEA